MQKKIAALILLAASAHGAHAAPAQDELGNLLAQKGIVARLGDTIHQATDRAADLVLNAMGSLGVPYRMGGTSAETGFDCSGFVRAMFQQTVGLMLPRTSAEQAAATSRIEKTDLHPGDLVFFNTRNAPFSHVGIYIGDERFVHAPSTNGRVRIDQLTARYYAQRFEAARTYFD